MKTSPVAPHVFKMRFIAYATCFKKRQKDNQRVFSEVRLKKISTKQAFSMSRQNFIHR